MKKVETKTLVYASTAVVLLAVGVYFFVAKKGGQMGPTDTTSSISDTSSTSSTVGGSTKPVSNVSLPATQKYLDARKIYKTSGYYFQFVNCSGMPGSLTMKKGVKFMLDNRDAKAHKIAIQGGQSFNIGPYGFAIATAPSTVGTHYITCDGGGAATIVVQK